MRKDMVFYVEAKYYIGTLYKYKYSNFSTFRPGVNYFSFTAGFAWGKTRLFTKKLKMPGDTGNLQ